MAKCHVVIFVEKSVLDKLRRTTGTRPEMQEEETKTNMWMNQEGVTIVWIIYWPSLLGWISFYWLHNLSQLVL